MIEERRKKREASEHLGLKQTEGQLAKTETAVDDWQPGETWCEDGGSRKHITSANKSNPRAKQPQKNAPFLLEKYAFFYN